MSATATQHDAIWFIDNLARIRVAGTETEGQLTIVELAGRRGHMPPLHIHHREAEAFVVLEGELTVYVGDEVVPLSAGETTLGPRGVPHTFSVDSEAARWLTVCTPAGFERFVAAAGEPAREPVLPAAPVAPSPEVLAATAGEFGIELLGPPGTLPS